MEGVMGEGCVGCWVGARAVVGREGEIVWSEGGGNSGRRRKGASRRSTQESGGGWDVVGVDVVCFMMIV